MVEVHTKPDVRLSDLGPDDVDHYTCCYDDTALCGYDVSGFDWVEPVEEPHDCALCVLLLPKPCSPDCPGDSDEHR